MVANDPLSTSKINKSSDANAKLLLFSEKDILNYLQEEDAKNNCGGERGKPEPAFQRLYKKNQEMLKKREEMKQQRDGDLSACTFQPSLSTSMLNSSAMAGKRSKNEFYSDQMKFWEEKERKLEQQRKI